MINLVLTVYDSADDFVKRAVVAPRIVSAKEVDYDCSDNTLCVTVDNDIYCSPMSQIRATQLINKIIVDANVHNISCVLQEIPFAEWPVLDRYGQRTEAHDIYDALIEAIVEQNPI